MHCITNNHIIKIYYYNVVKKNMSCMVFLSLFFFGSLSDFIDSAILLFGGTDLPELPQTKVMQKPDCGNGHIDHTPGSLKSNAKYKTPAEFQVQRFEKYN